MKSSFGCFACWVGSNSYCFISLIHAIMDQWCNFNFEIIFLCRSSVFKLVVAMVTDLFAHADIIVFVIIELKAIFEMLGF